MLSTRSRVDGACVQSPKALLTNPWYRKHECRGGRGVQAEAIAQARAIARLNATGAFGDTAPIGGITANLQWEVAYAGGRIDILGYDRSDPSSVVRLIELKQQRNGGAAEALSQLSRYEAGFRSIAGGRAIARYTGSYDDAFRVLITDCNDAGARNQVVNQYTVTATPAAPGVFLIKGPVQDVTPCPENGEEQEIPAEEEVPEQMPEDTWDSDLPDIYPAPGRDDDNDGKDDFWEKFLEDHPELDDLPWPALPEVPVAQGSTVTVDQEVLVALGVVVGLAVLCCASSRARRWPAGPGWPLPPPGR